MWTQPLSTMTSAMTSFPLPGISSSQTSSEAIMNKIAELLGQLPGQFDPAWSIQK